MLGGCCCSHIGAVEGLAARHDRLGVIWFDAHGDLNTPETSPSGQRVGDAAADDHRRRRGRRASDVALVGARNLDPPEVEFIAAAGIHDDPEAVLDRVDCVYVALDCDVFEPSELAVVHARAGRADRRRASSGSFGADPRARHRRRRRADRPRACEPANVEKLERLTAALGL